MTGTIPKKDVYRTSRLMYIIEACIENFITILTSGVYLASLTKYLGISDGMTAIISSVINLSALFQIITVFLSNKTPVKGWLIPVHVLSHVLFCFLYLLPMLNIKAGVGIIFFFLITGAHALKKIVSPVRISWFFSLVEPQKRGSFSSILTAVSVIGMIPFTLVASFVFDGYVNSGNMRGAFIMLTVVIVVLTVLDAIPLIISKEKPQARTPNSSPFSSVKSLVENKKYVTYLIIHAIQSIAISLILPFTYTYQISELGFSLSFISIMETVVNVVWIALLLLFGRFSRKLPYSFFQKMCTLILLAAFTVLAFTTPENGKVMYWIYKIIYIAYMAANAISANNIVFDIVDREHQTNALSISGIILGVLSFLTTLATTPLFNYLQSNMSTVFGVNLFAQQVLSILAVIILLAVAILWITIGQKLTVRHDGSDGE